MTANAEIVLEEHPNSLIVPEVAIVVRRPEARVRGPRRSRREERTPARPGEARRRQRHTHPGARRRQGRRQDRPALVGQPWEAIVQSFENLRANRSAQLPHDVRHPVGDDLGRHSLGDRARASAAATTRCCASSARTSASSGAGAPACRPAASAPAARSSSRWTMHARWRPKRRWWRSSAPNSSAARSRAKSSYNAASARVTGIEPPYQKIRTIELEYGRQFTWTDERRCRAWPSSGYDMADQLFGKRHILGETLMLDGVPYTVVGKIRKKEQDSNYNGPDNEQDLRAVRGHAAGHAAEGCTGRQPVRHRGGPEAVRLSTRLPARAERADRPHRGYRVAAREATCGGCWHAAMGSIRRDNQAVTMWDTSLETLMFGRMIDRMKDFFTIVGVVTLALGGIGVMNIMLIAVKERTREIGVRKALGATTRSIQQQFFMEGFFLTLLSGGGRHADGDRHVSAGQPRTDARSVLGDDSVVAGRGRCRSRRWSSSALPRRRIPRGAPRNCLLSRHFASRCRR